MAVHITVKQGAGPEALKQALDLIRKKKDAKLDLQSFVGILPRVMDPIEFQKQMRDDRKPDFS